MGPDMQENETKANDALSMGRAISINLLRSTKAMAVKCRPKDKKPMKGWDPRNNSEANSEAVVRDVEFSQDNFGIHLTGRWMDVDVDTDDPHVFAALDAFLPATPHVYGRKGKPRSHRLYMSNGEDYEPTLYPFLRALKRIPEAQVELRGGALSRGEYSLLPGSVHPSGEAYEWDHIGHARSTPVTVPIESVIKGLRKATAVAVLAQHWQEGSRQEMAMALAGFLQRVHHLSESAGDDGFYMAYDEAIDFFKTFLTIVNDDQGDRRDRLAAFKMTWDKGADGKIVTGASRIAEIASDPHIVRKLYTLLTSNPDLQRLESFLQRYAIWYGTGDLIDLDAAQLGSKAIMSRTAALNSMGHERYNMGDKSVNMIDYLYVSASTSRVHGFEFAPDKDRLFPKGGMLVVNQWGGFETTPESTADGRVPTEDDVKPFVDYIRNTVARGREDLYKWILAWVADILQEPHIKKGTCLVLVGKPGAGKSSLGDIIRMIIGDRHTAQTNDLENVTAKHNTQYVNKLFIQCDEATNSRQRATTAKLKSLITDRTQKVEPKNVDSYEVQALARFMATSNEIKDAVHLPDGLSDRRFTIAHVDESLCDNIDHWEKFHAWCTRNKGLIMSFLLHHDYDRKILRRCLVTDEKYDMVASSWNATERWMVNALNTLHPIPVYRHENPFVTIAGDDPNAVPKAIVRDEWPRWIDETALTNAINDAAGDTGARIRVRPHDAARELVSYGILKDTPAQVVKRVEFDDRTGARKNTLYKYVELVPYDELVTVVKKLLGYVPRGYKLLNIKDEDEGEF